LSEPIRELDIAGCVTDTALFRNPITRLN